MSRSHHVVRSLVAMVALAACGSPNPERVDPCVKDRYWNASIESDEYPIVVHHRRRSEDLAWEVLGLVEDSWRFQVGELGFRPPPSDNGDCGDSDAFDVFVWEGPDEAWVTVLDAPAAGGHDSYPPYMVVDASGTYGGELLDVTIAHEFNHACQAADDWSEPTAFFEASATFVEDVQYDDDNSYLELLVDFQQRPGWALFHDDNYATWYMYAAALYLHFLREVYFDDDASYLAEVWFRSRSDANPDELAERNEPDFEDALDAMLRDRGSSYVESIAEFAVWRWFVASRDDGEHFSEAALVPEEARIMTAVTVSPSTEPQRIPVRPMLTGTVYVELASADLDVTAVEADGVDWRTQWVTDRVVAITALPVGDFDAEDDRSATFPLDVIVSVRED